ncbi:hypothetical protein C7444_110125 [Sphaerotilus hippei]|uniref:Uncharacterized protein n=1 Tax=Sphaerotilus hippei TaxID=744406 RepID=A0A318GYR1_9BURK|nr:YceH family protein [Sphaerotilus hippei]PXW95277.1 hypothetical protein C7444_110125 [Sphaerotilus hippei]
MSDVTSHPARPAVRALTALEARVLAVLVEKQATVPDTYPMSINALIGGCNQKTARDPVMAVAEGDVLLALDGLKSLHLVLESSGSRVVRYEHNLGRVYGVPGQAVALLAMLMLRGPQTAAELRLHCERLHRFADVSSVEGFLDELMERQPARVVRLPRAPGAREARWAHLLCGEVDLGPVAAGVAPTGVTEELQLLRAEQAQLRDEVRRLSQRLAQLEDQLGVSREEA